MTDQPSSTPESVAMQLPNSEAVANQQPGLYRQPPFADAVAIVASAYQLPPEALQVALSIIGKRSSENLQRNFAGNSTPEMRRHGILFPDESYGKSVSFKISAQAFLDRRARKMQTHATHLNSKVLQRAILVLAFGRQEINAHPAEGFIKTGNRVIQAANGPQTNLIETPELEQYDGLIPENFSGLDGFPGIWEYLHQAQVQLADGVIDSTGSIVNPTYNLKRFSLFDTYKAWVVKRVDQQDPRYFGLSGILAALDHITNDMVTPKKW